jgi:hypothetical protein
MGVRSVIDNLESTEDTKALNAFLTSAEKDRQFCGRRARVQVHPRSSKERLETTTTRNCSKGKAVSFLGQEGEPETQ